LKKILLSAVDDVTKEAGVLLLTGAGLEMSMAVMASVKRYVI
jgi:hypothetical protein